MVPIYYTYYSRLVLLPMVALSFIIITASFNPTHAAVAPAIHPILDTSTTTTTTKSKDTKALLDFIETELLGINRTANADFSDNLQIPIHKQIDDLANLQTSVMVRVHPSSASHPLWAQHPLYGNMPPLAFQFFSPSKHEKLAGHFSLELPYILQSYFRYPESLNTIRGDKSMWKQISTLFIMSINKADKFSPISDAEADRRQESFKALTDMFNRKNQLDIYDTIGKINDVGMLELQELIQGYGFPAIHLIHQLGMFAGGARQDTLELFNSEPGLIAEFLWLRTFADWVRRQEFVEPSWPFVYACGTLYKNDVLWLPNYVSHNLSRHNNRFHGLFTIYANANSNSTEGLIKPTDVVPLLEFKTNLNKTGKIYATNIHHPKDSPFRKPIHVFSPNASSDLFPIRSNRPGIFGGSKLSIGGDFPNVLVFTVNMNVWELSMIDLTKINVPTGTNMNLARKLIISGTLQPGETVERFEIVGESFVDPFTLEPRTDAFITPNMVRIKNVGLFAMDAYEKDPEGKMYLDNLFITAGLKSKFFDCVNRFSRQLGGEPALL